MGYPWPSESLPVPCLRLSSDHNEWFVAPETFSYGPLLPPILNISTSLKYSTANRNSPVTRSLSRSTPWVTGQLAHVALPLGLSCPLLRCPSNPGQLSNGYKNVPVESSFS